MKKRVAWAMMTGGFGAALLFGMAVVVEGSFPNMREVWVYVWPGGGVLVGAVGWIWLRRLYRAEPPEPPAAWTVTLTDLILATVFAGVCSSVFMGMEERYARLVPAVGLLGFVFYLHSSLAASLRAVIGGWRAPFVIANTALTLGAMGWMTMGLLSLIVLGREGFGDLFRFWSGILFGWNEKGWIQIIRASVYAWPIGWILMALVKWRIGKTRGDVLLRS